MLGETLHRRLRTAGESKVRGLGWSVGVTCALVLAACGGGSTSNGSPIAESNTPIATGLGRPTPSPLVSLGAIGEACELVTADEAKSVLGELKAAPSPAASGVPAGPPGMLKGSACDFRSDGGSMTLILIRFTDAAAAHAALTQFPAPGGAPASQPQPVAGVGDEAIASSGPLPSPYSGAGFFYVVRKGAAAFVLGGSVISGGPPDVQGAALTLAKKAAAKL